MDRRRLMRRFLLVMGSVLVAGSSVVAFLWFWLLAPCRHVSNGEWVATHSAEALWEETQRKILRIGWGHDDGSMVAGYGGKEWAAWIISGIREGQDIGDCRRGHKDSALQGMTNQGAGFTAKDWLDWWGRNRNKSQRQWLLDGFAQNGVVLQWPLSREDRLRLLEVMGADEKQPRGYRLSAFRLLRDSDFDPETITVRDLPPGRADPMLKGLVRFSKWSAMWPELDGVGLLRPEGPQRAGRLLTPVVYEYGFTATTGAVLGLLFVVGVYCLAVYVKTRPAKARKAEASSPAT